MRPMNLLITRLQGLAPEAAFKIFDKRILPILCYGAEIWGYEWRESIEKVHVTFCRFVLGVGKCSIPSAVLGECGRSPLICTYLKRPIKFWLKILKLEEEKLMYKAYKLQLQLVDRNVVCWSARIKLILYEYGFGHVWLSQGVGNGQQFINIFQARIKDIQFRKWCTAVNQYPKLECYKEFKMLLNPEKY